MKTYPFSFDSKSALFFLKFFSKIIAALTFGTSTLAHGSLKVSAASSLTDVLPKVASAWTKISGIDVQFSFDSSSRLAKQIVAGAPVDLYFSADREWIDYLIKKKRNQEGMERPFLSNRLVVVTPQKPTFPSEIRIYSAQDLRNPQITHLAVASEFVPVGKLARAFLQFENLFSDLKPRLVNAPHSRGVLRWVAAGQMQAGIVFLTDALAEPKVRIAFEIDSNRHPRIEYFGVTLTEISNGRLAKSFLDYCRESEEARNLFEKAGFIYLRPPNPTL